MNPSTQSILKHLADSAAERAARAADKSLAEARDLAVKRYQQARFERTYADLLSQPALREQRTLLSG